MSTDNNNEKTLNNDLRFKTFLAFATCALHDENIDESNANVIALVEDTYNVVITDDEMTHIANHGVYDILESFGLTHVADRATWIANGAMPSDVTQSGLNG